MIFNRIKGAVNWNVHITAYHIHKGVSGDVVSTPGQITPTGEREIIEVPLAKCLLHSSIKGRACLTPHQFKVGSRVPTQTHRNHVLFLKDQAVKLTEG